MLTCVGLLSSLHENSVHDGDVLSRDLVDGDVAELVARVRWVDEKKEVPAVERWFHGATI